MNMEENHRAISFLPYPSFAPHNISYCCDPGGIPTTIHTIRFICILDKSATVATVGVGLTIPMAFLSDWIMGHPDVVDPSSIIGALAVLVGFVLVNLSTATSETEVRTGINENDLIDNELGVGVDGSISDQHDNPNVRGDGMSEVSLRPIRGRSRNRSLAPEEP